MEEGDGVATSPLLEAGTSGTFSVSVEAGTATGLGGEALLSISGQKTKKNPVVGFPKHIPVYAQLVPRKNVSRNIYNIYIVRVC